MPVPLQENSPWRYLGSAELSLSSLRQIRDPQTALWFMLVCDFAGRKASGSSVAGCGVPAENRKILLVYLISGAGNPSENARSNDARSTLGKSETAT